MQRDNFADYGHAFQTKIIAALLTDRIFLQQISDILEPKFFESQANSWLVEHILEYFVSYKAVPTPDVFKAEIVSIEDKLLKTTIIDSLKEAVKQQSATDLTFVKDTTVEFCKNQQMKVALLESVDLLKSGKFDAIRKKIDTALRSGADKDVGHEYKDQLEERYAIGARKCVATGWEVIDDVTSGGLGNGELGVVVAAAGGGKSWSLINIAAKALLQGKNVVYYTLELNAYYVGRRIDAYITKIPFQDLGEDMSKERIQSMLPSISGNLIIRHYSSRVASVSTLASHIEKCIAQGKKPDLIIVDYADLLRPAKTTDKRLELNDIYEDLRGLAGEYDLPCWTASQSNRSSLEDDIIEGGKVSESYNKIMVGDFVMSLSRKTNDKVGGTGRWHIIKNRFGPDGITFPSKINTNNGHIDIYEPTSQLGKSVSESMQNDVSIKKSLAQKFKSLEGF